MERGGEGRGIEREELGYSAAREQEAGLKVVQYLIIFGL